LLSGSSVETKVTLLHFSDYHSHAVPFFAEHAPDQAGIARAVAYAKNLRVTAKNVLVLGGGDLLNAGTPAWSDKFYKTCTDWTWWNDIVSVMAFGNHDADYGWEAFSACRAKASYPILSGNLVDAGDRLILSDAGKPYVVRQVGDVRIGIFALAGPDFARLVKPANLPPGARFSDGMAAAKKIVSTLREQEKVQAVVFIGHQDRETDFAMAATVPGIDLILGTHSHYKGPLQQIPGTQTWFISPFQYLNYLSQVALTFRGGTLVRVEGALVKMDAAQAQDPMLTWEVARMQTDLESDPLFTERFVRIGEAAVELDLDGIDSGESILGNFAMDVVRGSPAVRAQAIFSTASSFRASIPPGRIRMEDYLTAIPYKNRVLLYRLTGEQLQAVLDYGVSKRGSDNFGVTSGLRYTVSKASPDRARDVQVLRDPSEPTPTFEPLQTARVYTVAATDFVALIAGGYSERFKVATPTDTGAIVNDLIIDHIRRLSPVRAARDGRVRVTD
jgi:5'-nucleotidase